ncbi:hypothetical protein BaRGS_00005627 [Batillaria attramentaria]|uniref:C1q domain-containing protein n=1 Tax=Batillaria attramentaria TaxID=370345 RepID=A0ABD0LV36_9CAEN
MMVSGIVLFALLGMCKSEMVKRSDATPPLETVVTNLASELLTLKAQLAALKTDVDQNKGHLSQHVGFSVGLSQDVITTVTVGTTVKFDSVYSNAGNGYDHVTGIFTAPISGMFAFYFKTEVEAGKGVGLDLTREGHTIAHIYAGGPTSTVYETAGDLEVVHLNKGERLWHWNHAKLGVDVVLYTLINYYTGSWTETVTQSRVQGLYCQELIFNRQIGNVSPFGQINTSLPCVVMASPINDTGDAIGPAVTRCDDVISPESVMSRLTSELQALQAEQAAMKTNIELLLLKQAELGGVGRRRLAAVPDNEADNRRKQNVGFTVALRSDRMTNVSAGQTVKFDHIYVNSGGGFDPKTGVFTAPAEGLYVFFIKTEVHVRMSVGLDLQKDGSSVAHIGAEGHNVEGHSVEGHRAEGHSVEGHRVEGHSVESHSAEDQSAEDHSAVSMQSVSDLTVLELSKGQRVWVVRTGTSDGYLTGGHATRFSGFLLP